MYELPTVIETNCGELHIRNKGDYRVILDCFNVLEDVELAEDERYIACLIIFYEEFNELEDVLAYGDLEGATTKMVKFFDCNQTQVGASVSGKVVDWEQDSMLICSAINEIVRDDIRGFEYLHWFTFMSYYLAIGDCTFATVVGIRNKILKQKKLEKYEQQFRKENPHFFVWNSKSVEQREADEWVKQMWNKK